MINEVFNDAVGPIQGRMEVAVRAAAKANRSCKSEKDRAEIADKERILLIEKCERLEQRAGQAENKCDDLTARILLLEKRHRERIAANEAAKSR